MKILVTGHKGFIGAHITKKLDALGIAWEGFDLVEGDDVRNIVRLDTVLEKSQADIIIHLAALAGVRRGEDYPQQYFDTNVIGTNNLIRVAEKYKVKKLIAFSSSSVDGGNPKGVYGTSKLAMEHLVRRANLPFKFIVRPFTVYGEGGRRDQVIFKWKEQYLNGKPLTFFGDGSAYRTQVYAGDLADAVMMMLTYEPADDSDITFEIGGGERITVAKILEIFQSKYPDAKVERLPLPSCDSLGREPDMYEVTKMGWKPKTDFTTKVTEII